jgi:hypothetical protein
MSTTGRPLDEGYDDDQRGPSQRVEASSVTHILAATQHLTEEQRLGM